MAETGSDTSKAAPTAQPSRAKASPAKAKAPAKGASSRPDKLSASAKTCEHAESASSKAPVNSKSVSKTEPVVTKSATAVTEATTAKTPDSKRAAPKNTTSSQRKLKAQVAKVVPSRTAGPSRPGRTAARRAVYQIAPAAADMHRVAMAAPADNPAAAVEAVTKSSVKAAEAVTATVATSVDAAVKSVKDGNAKPSLSPSMPHPPEFAVLTGSAVMTQTLSMARAFGTLQAKMLDHACAEFSATLAQAETLSKTTSASDAVALQAKAVRRSFQSYADHLKELARIASGFTKKD